MKCPNCGGEIREGSRFCTLCGTKIEAQAQPGNYSIAPQQQAPARGAQIQPQAAAYSSAPAYAPAGAQRYEAVSPYFNYDKLFVNQKILSIREAYSVFNEQGQELFFILRALLALKRHTKIFTDRGKQNQILSLKQDHLFPIPFAWYVLEDVSGNIIAKFRRNTFLSVLRRTWHVFLPDGSFLCEAAEDSWFKAFVRRFVPMGEFLKTDFVITAGDRTLGKFIRKITISDKYVLDLTADTSRYIDRRIGLALCVLLDSAEKR